MACEGLVSLVLSSKDPSYYSPMDGMLLYHSVPNHEVTKEYYYIFLSRGILVYHKVPKYCSPIEEILVCHRVPKPESN